MPLNAPQGFAVNTHPSGCSRRRHKNKDTTIILLVKSNRFCQLDVKLLRRDFCSGLSAWINYLLTTAAERSYRMHLGSLHQWAWLSVLHHEGISWGSVRRKKRPQFDVFCFCLHKIWSIGVLKECTHILICFCYVLIFSACTNKLANCATLYVTFAFVLPRLVPTWSSATQVKELKFWLFIQSHSNYCATDPECTLHYPVSILCLRQWITYAAWSWVQTQHAWKCKTTWYLDEGLRLTCLIAPLKIQWSLPSSRGMWIAASGVKRWGRLWLCRDVLLECSLTSDCLEALCTLSRAYL